MNKYERLLYILNRLRSRKNLTARELAHECSVTERTIFRDITALSSASIPIYYDRGYKLLTGNFLPTLNFSLKEYLTVREALRTTPMRRNPEHRMTLRAIEAKIAACLSPQVIEETKTTPLEQTLFIKERPASVRHTSWLGVVEQSIRQRKKITMTYTSIDSGDRRREVEPVFSIYVDGKFYFVGFCHLRKKYRTFRLSRIKELSLTEERFPRRTDISPETYFEDSWSVFSGEAIDAKLIFSGRAARLVNSGSYLKNETKVLRPDGKLLYTARVSGLAEIGRWIMGFGSEVEILAPSRLRNWVIAQADGILACHGKGNGTNSK